MSRVRLAPESMRRFGGGGISAFAEMLVIGLGITALALPLITLVPALAAGTRHLDEHLEHRGDSLRDLFRLGWQAIRSGWLFGAASFAVLALLAFNVMLGLQGLIPGGVAFAAVSGALAIAALVVICRIASLWTPGSKWSQMWRSGRTLAIDDPIGSVFVLVGILVSVTVVWMLPPLIVIAPGLLAVSIVAAERRRRI